MSIFKTKKNYELFYEHLTSTSNHHTETVAFFNGIMASHDSWRMQLPPLRKHGMNILSHDFVGQLKSTKLNDTYSLKAHADDFIELMDSLKIEKVHLVGTSYGGEVAQRFAIDHPDRIKTLTLIDTLSEIDATMKYGVALWRTLAEGGDGEKLIKGLIPDIYGSAFVNENEKIIEQIIEKYKSFPRDYYFGLIHLLDTFSKDVHLTSELKKILTPTLVICADNDLIKPLKFSKIIHDNIKNSEMMIIPNCGHCAFIERPNIVNSAMLGFIMKNI